MTQKVPIQDWWYVRLYPGGAATMDAAIQLVLPWMDKTAREYDADRWFFIRYVDITGQHLRLRMRCAPDGVDDMHSRNRKLVQLLLDAELAVTPTRLVAGAELMDAPGPVKIRPGLYAPEYLKYGGAKGVDIAENLFTASCQWFLRQAIVLTDPVGFRLALAVELMTCISTRFLSVPDRQSFWMSHRMMWGRRLRQVVSSPERLRERIATVEQVLVNADHNTVHETVSDLVEAIGTALDQLKEWEVPIARGDVLREYLHMEMNRMGYMPAEECLLGMVAAARVALCPDGSEDSPGAAPAVVRDNGGCEG